MKLYFMKQSAIDYMKANMKTLYMNYFTYRSNGWIYDLFEDDPFEFFMEIPDFELAEITSSTGEVEFENCKRLFSNLKKISESQASDERLWAGLCNGVFYSYVRARWNYGSLRPKKPETDASTIISRFFFSGGGRGGLYRNTLSKCWWVGRSTYDSDNKNHWNMLDVIGPEDFATKVSDIFYSNTFAANPEILQGICMGLNFFREKSVKLLVRDHIRPTMQYLNALGGGILLDALDKEDISTIVIENIGKIINGEQSDFFTVDEDEDIEIVSESGKEINLDYKSEKKQKEQEKETVDVGSVLGNPETVERGRTVIVVNQKSMKAMKYVIPLEGERDLWEIEQKMLGKKIGDIIRVRINTYMIEEIRW